MLQLSINDPEILAKICHALSTELRLEILSLLEHDTLSCLEISKQLSYPLSTISANVKILEEAGLILTELAPAKNGSKKLCSSVYLDVLIHLGIGAIIPKDSKKYETSIPIGNYMDFNISPSCGMVIFKENNEAIDDSPFDDSNYFLNPKRVDAQLLWFRKGYVEYRVPVYDSLHLKPEFISFSLEICSEAPGFNNVWKSDITMWINGIEIGTWICPGDFGDRNGKLTPSTWMSGSTQYGILTEWTVTDGGAQLNQEPISNICLSQLDIQKGKYITMRIGVKDTSEHIGGINIFGEKFGDYPQNIIMTIGYNNELKKLPIKEK
jgi:predicted transcriptional regulator